MNISVLAAVFLIGLVLGVVAHRMNFCVFGALVEWFTGSGIRRLWGVLGALGVFALIHFWGFGGNPPWVGSWGEYAGLHTFIGGLLQGIGYVLLAGCPLSLCVRIGEGSKFHLVAVAGFALGIALFVQLGNSIMRLFEPFVYTGAFSVLELFHY